MLDLYLQDMPDEGTPGGSEEEAQTPESDGSEE